MHARGGTDAVLDIEIDGHAVHIDFEVKSTTTDTVSTARDVGVAHIERWRQKHWVIGFYHVQVGIRARLAYALYLTPTDMAPWLSDLAAYIAPDAELGARVPERLTEDDLVAICGDKPSYSELDARRVLKKQWKREDYHRHFDLPPDSPTTYSRQRMLEILRLRARYTMRRGATLNNPHVSKRFLQRFNEERVTDEFAQALRHKLRTYLTSLNAPY